MIELIYSKVREQRLISPLLKNKAEESTNSERSQAKSNAQNPVSTDGGTELSSKRGSNGTTGQSADTNIDFDDEKLLNGIGLPLFMLDASGSCIAWNESIEQLAGVAQTEVKRDTSIAEALYSTVSAEPTLAERVLQAPDHAHDASDVTVADGDLSVYETERRVSMPDGSDRHYECSARPLYQDGQLAGVLQTVQERTDEVRRHDTISSLVEELIATFEAIAAGDLEARAEFNQRTDAVDQELFAVIDEVNRMADQLESLAERVEAQTETLAELGEESAEAAARIDTHVAEQRDLLGSAGAEMEEFSANMEEVAASADEIAAAADDAQTAAEEGREAGERAREATDSVTETSDELVDTVQQLEASITDVETMLEVIDDVAEQTNLLALNASIESARAGTAGDGFGVVADEIKELAAETREHTEAIDESVGTIQSQAETATSAVEQSHSQVTQTSEQIDSALASLDEIAKAVDETAVGIREVADANDAQATAVQDVLGIIEDAREQADHVEDASDEIVVLVENQQSGIEELQERVRSLSQTE
ncbi:methyl-accepting chemotaxis protein [Halosimplex pelagicum]|uniref:PAS domain-containing protein n=1 Tax=Halosimplex pelagicum TaxID=869886 RepID=A0A7D5TCG6_9EURY|nr:methyl-accepting chemotaxis protein [Halosimplex pelagicum]QLH82035.1 PAS domain-containing protein [Halosimplex pelagicum]